MELFDHNYTVLISFQDPVGNIKKISNFLGLDRDHEFCEQVAKLTSFDTMVTHVGKVEGMKKHVSALWKDGTNKFFRKGIKFNINFLVKK